MQVSLPPFALTPAAFRFPALASLSARSALGAGREAILAVLLTARLADGAVSGRFAKASREQRATSATQWLGTSCPDPRIRAACAAVVAASADDSPDLLARALTKLIDAAGAHLDGASRAELTALVRTITGTA